jgi:polysaccharide biosynthesis protein PslH
LRDSKPTGLDQCETDMRILMIATTLPYPMTSGERIRNYNLLRLASKRHEVSLAALVESKEDLEGVPHLQQFCARVETAGFDKRSRFVRAPGMLRYALEGKPPELKLLRSEELISKIRHLVSAMDFDIVEIDSRLGLYLEELPNDRRCKSIMMFHNFTFQQGLRIFRYERRWGKKIRKLLDSIAMFQWEPRYAMRFDRCTTVSEIDRDLYLKTNPRLQIDVIPNGVDIQKYTPLPADNASPTLLFIGNMGYSPCVDAMLYFCREIFPLIRQAVSGVELWIVGKEPLPEVLRLNGDGVHVTGQVEDVIPYYKHSAVCVVPLRSGGGTRLKILEAMALGRPVVSTTIGCEGLDVVDGQHLLIADKPANFAEKTVRLLNDRELYQHIAAEGRTLVVRKYDWNIIGDSMMKMYDELAKLQRTK